MNDSLSCLLRYESFNYTGKLFCNATFDDVLCWPPTEGGTNVSQNCPAHKGIDPTKLAWRKCNEDGTWFSNNNTNYIEKGYTDYSNCFNKNLAKLLRVCSSIGMNICMTIINKTRKLEMVGLSLSFLALVLSLVIFYKYRILRNNRTTIHKNLFLAMLLQVSLRLILYADQAKTNYIDNFKILCETCCVLLEFSKISTIMWMFIEGLYLHNAITVTVFQEHSYIKIYCYIGWIVPQILTFIWVISMVYTETDHCWFLYHFLPNYWILEGPSSAFIVVNMLFLLNIIRILVMKLRESNMGEIEQVRKAVRAAIFLVPLMGTCNILFMIDYRLFKEAWKFALWAYTVHFFTTFQGFFIATLYCFLNGEVRDAIKNSLAIYMSLRQDNVHRRNSMEDTGLSVLDPEL